MTLTPLFHTSSSSHSGVAMTGLSTTKYRSTRGGETGVSFENVVLGGLATDRGLYVPETLPTVSSEELTQVI